MKKKINKKLNGSLANPDLALETKLETLKSLNPGLRGKIKSLRTASLLTEEEENALIQKGFFLQEEAERKLELDQCLTEEQSQNQEIKSTNQK